LGLVFDSLHWRKHIVHKLLIVGFAVVVLAHLAIDFNLMAYNTQRNMPTALQRGFDGETGVTRIAEPAIRAIRSANRIHIPYAHWEVLYWNFIRHNPGARYTTGAEYRAPDSGTLSLISVEGDEFHPPAPGTPPDGRWLIGRVPGSGQAGLTYLGQSSSGYVFGAGANVDVQNPAGNGYFVVPAEVSRRPGSESPAKLTVKTNAIQGLDKVEFRAISESSGGRRWASPWLVPHSGLQTVETPAGDTWKELILESRSTLNRESVCEVRQQRPFVSGECDNSLHGSHAPAARPDRLLSHARRPGLR
jgi:hypothetical protein